MDPSDVLDVDDVLKRALSVLKELRVPYPTGQKELVAAAKRLMGRKQWLDAATVRAQLEELARGLPGEQAQAPTEAREAELTNTSRRRRALPDACALIPPPR